MRILSWVLVIAVGAGLISVPCAIMYEHPELYFTFLS